MRTMSAVLAAGVLFGAAVWAQGADPNGGTSQLDMDVTITFQDGLVLTFVDQYGWNAAAGYVYTDVSGVVAEDDTGEQGGWPSTSQSASASTANGAAHGSVTTNTPGFDYSIHADAMVEGLTACDYGLALGYAYAWPDWLRCDHAGTARITIDYTYTLDMRDTSIGDEAWVFMNAFFADHARTNQLTAQGDWTIGPPNANGTTNVEYSELIYAGDCATLSDSVSWDIAIPDCDEPNSWWSLWAYGEAGAEVPEPATLGLLAVGGLAVLRRRRRKPA